MSGESLYSSPDKRFYVHWCKQDSMFHIHDRRRHDWRVITPELSTALGICDRYYREALDG
jgi:hypothetical protein